MEQIEVIKRKGGTIPLFSKEPFCTVKSAVQNTALMGDDNVQLSIVSSELLSFEKGDKIIVNGEEYTVRTRATREMQSDTYYTFEVVFYGVMYELMKTIYRNTDANGKSTSSTFDLTYSIADFVKVLIYNMNRDYPGLWKFDEENCPDTEPITISFSKQNCLQVLQTLCGKDNFKLDFRITQSNGVRTIHIGKFGTKVVPPGGGDFFEWGKGNGLFTLKDEKVDDKAIITRLWVEGGTNNIRSGYRNYSERLQLPYPKRLNAREHTLPDGTVIPAKSEMIGIDNDNDRFIEDAALKEEIGSEEDVAQYEGIYPKRTGVVTALVDGDINAFVDNTMDFDLTEKDANGTKYLINEVSAKITFTTGRLSGQQFELKKEGGYNHASKTFKIVPFTDKRGLTIPTADNEAYRINVGDNYKITDINLPKAYEDNAEEDLWYAGYGDFKPRTQARVQYGLTFDRSYFLTNMPDDSETSVFKVGDYVPVKDERFGIEKSIRIQKITRNLLVEHDYQLTLSDTTTISIQQQTVIDVIEHNKVIETNRLKDLNKARRGWRTTEELRSMIYDTDGYFDNENIRPNSIDTNMLTVGSKSQQFVLVGVVMEANAGGNPNKFVATAGTLAHLSIDENKIRQWNLAETTVTLTETSGYYVFAKCSKTGNNGVFVVTRTQYKVESTEDPNNYYFQVGIISSLYTDDKFRDFATTYGFTRINGKTITTGAIVTSDGECYLDLDGNRFRIGDATSSIDWNVTAKKQLTLHNVLLKSGSGDVSFIGVYRGAYNNSYLYYNGDEVSYNDGKEICTYRYKYPEPSKGIPPTNSTYWGVIAKGKDGDGRTSYVHIKYSDNGGLSFTANNGKTPGSYIGQYVDFEEKDSDNPGDYTWSLIKGQGGAAGSDATVSEYYEYRYAKNGSTVTPPSLDADADAPAGWSTTMPKVGALEYLWCTIAKKSGLLDKRLFDIPVGTSVSNPMQDVSGNNIDGIMLDGASIVRLGDRNALSLIENGECRIPYDLPFGKSFTLCFWMRTDETIVRWMLNGYNGREYVENILTVAKNTWFHLALRFNDRSVSIFKDGELVQTGSLNEKVIGFALYDDNMFGSSVLYDDIKLFSGALSDDDINKVKSNKTETLVQNWSTPFRINPYDGKDGKDGKDGQDGKNGESPVLVFRGVYSSSKTYYGNKYRLDAVKYNNSYYIARIDAGSFSNVTPTTTSKWNPFGAQFETIATNLLLAEGANIGNWYIQGGKIVSTLSGSNKITMDAASARFLIESTRSGGDYSQSQYQGSTIEINANDGTVEARSKTNTSRVAYMSPTGIFCNNAETQAVSAVLGYTHKASIVGLGFGTVNKSDWNNENFLAGVYGRASNTGTAPAYGGFFQNLMAAGLFLHRRGVEESDGTVYLQETDSLVIGYSRYQSNVYLPSDGVLGRVIFFKQWWTGFMRIYPRGGQKLFDDHTENSYIDVGEGWAAMCVFTIGYINNVKTESWLISKFRW